MRSFVFASRTPAKSLTWTVGAGNCVVCASGVTLTRRDIPPAMITGKQYLNARFIVLILDSLRNSNDLLRKAGVEWLITSFTTLAGEVNRVGSSLAITNDEGYRFRTGSSTMVGRRLTLANGVRTLFLEAGWPRTPRDGVVRGGGLACGTVRHLGLRDSSEEILLVKSESGAPRWVIVKKHGSRAPFHESSVRRHIAILLDRR